eukprot:g143.t1
MLRLVQVRSRHKAKAAGVVGFDHSGCERSVAATTIWADKRPSGEERLSMLPMLCVEADIAALPLGVIPEVVSESSEDSAACENTKVEEPKNPVQKQFKSEDSKGCRAVLPVFSNLIGLSWQNGFKSLGYGQKSSMYGFVYTYPLIEAVKQQNAVMASLLLKFGADPTLKDSYGWTAYRRAVKMKSCELLRVFERKQCSDEDLKIRMAKRGKSVCDRFPPPKGFETFFAALEGDPLAHKRPQVAKQTGCLFFRTIGKGDRLRVSWTSKHSWCSSHIC